jgi:hypothetical protein
MDYERPRKYKPTKSMLERRAVAKEEAAARVAAMRAPRGEDEGRRGGAPLPDACLERIMCCLAERAADPYGLVGPCLAARDIASASLACWCVVGVWGAGV